VAAPFVIHTITGSNTDAEAGDSEAAVEEADIAADTADTEADCADTEAHCDAADTGTDVDTDAADTQASADTDAAATPAHTSAEPPADTDAANDSVASLVHNDGILPPEQVNDLVEHARIRPLIHPGDAPAEPRYTPSRNLAEFVRCRDMGCRFPGCDVAAFSTDIDHTVPYSQGGPTQASNLKCLCRLHHLIKTFWGWHDQQHRDGTVIWTSPAGQTYTTRPGSAVLFPYLCAPTAAVIRRDTHDDPSDERTAMMPDAPAPGRRTAPPASPRNANRTANTAKPAAAPADKHSTHCSPPSHHRNPATNHHPSSDTAAAHRRRHHTSAVPACAREDSVHLWMHGT
jgi:hypothetical protein